MTPCLPPAITFQGARWSTEALTATAAGWRSVLGATWLGSTRPVALVMANHPDAVALLFALSCAPAPLVLLPPDLRPWRSSPPLPPGTRLALLHSQRSFEADARAVGLDVAVLPPGDARSSSGTDLPFMTMPGVVLFTSGSTGVARPVYRRTSTLLRLADALVTSLGLSRGGSVIATLPLARAFGLSHGLMAAMALGSSLHLFERFDRSAMVRLFDSGECRYWAGTAVMANVLSRSPEPKMPASSPVCVIGSHLSDAVVQRFRARFGVTLRQVYGTTETGSICVDTAPDDDGVRPLTAGRPMPGVTLSVGDDPRAPVPPGMLGRIWLRTPEFMMDGYGFPPALEPPELLDGWWGSPDAGSVDESGHLTLSGRLDDCFRTSGGYLVSPARVASALESYPGVIDAAIVPLAATSGPVLGVLVETADRLSVGHLREHLSRSLPAWSQPRVIEMTQVLPRQPNGRADRRACISILEKALGNSV